MWHVSAASNHLTAHALRKVALRALDGVGNPRLGEWVKDSARGGLVFVHVKRRLRPTEQARTGDAVDVRGTSEETARIAACPWAPAGYAE